VYAGRFWQLFNALPVEVQELARKNHQLWLEDTRHPSLRFKLLQGKIWSIRGEIITARALKSKADKSPGFGSDIIPSTTG
jgi:hypothetical protein